MVEMSLEQRWDYFMERSIDFDPAMFRDVKMRNAASSIMSKVAFLRADTFWRPSTVGQSKRYGLSFYLKNQRPMIYLNILKHEGDEQELFDTILHEALHCSALYLGRHDELPNNDRTTSYLLEELCVSSGLCKIYPMLKIPAMRDASRRQKVTRDKMHGSLMQHVPETICGEWVEKGNEAADWLFTVINSEIRT